MKRDSRGRFVTDVEDSVCGHELFCTDRGTDKCTICQNRRKKSYYVPEKSEVKDPIYPIYPYQPYYPWPNYPTWTYHWTYDPGPMCK